MTIWAQRPGKVRPAWGGYASRKNLRGAAQMSF
jgi:hypothetical protein